LVFCGHLTSPRAATAESLLDHYQHHGLRFAQALRGAFVLAVLDGDRLLLFRDGAGRRTVYHTMHHGRFVFAIEPKALYRMPGFSPRLRPGAVAQYLTFSFVPGEGTMLEDIFELPAGAYLDYHGGQKSSWRAERYVRVEDVALTTRELQFSDADWIARFQEHFSDATEDLRPRGEPVAIYLSGGIDSSIVTAEVKAHHDEQVKTFSVHFGSHYPNELAYARLVAAHCGVEHEEVLIQPRNFLPQLHDMIWHLDEPIGDPVAMPNYELARYVARQGFRWVFNGEGGDPCFGGPKNLPLLLQHWYGGVQKTPNFREKLYLASYRRAYEEMDHLLTPEWRQQIDPVCDLEAILTPFFQTQHPHRFLDKLLAINMRLKGAHLILPKVERMLAAAGLMPLSPLFDERLMQLAFALPGHLKLHHGVEKIILKKAFVGRVPQAVIERPKSGMRVPVHFWFQGELRRYARKLLSPRQVKAAGMFRPERVQQLLRYDTEEGEGRFGLRLWMLLTLELWRRMVFHEEV
jgi:asparagine synthase (glutamine-hydrolysing)